MKYGLACLLFPLSAMMAQSTVTEPVAGYIFDRISAQIRPLGGILGVASVRPGIDLGGPVVAAVPSPSGDFALVRLDDGSAPALALLRPSSVSLRAVPGIMATPDSMALSPSGTAALLYQQQPARLQLLRGLPQNVEVAEEIELSSLASGLDLLAVADDASLALGRSPSGVILLVPGMAPRVIAPFPNASVSFVPGSHDALLADAGSNTALLIRAPDATAETILIGGPDDGLSAPSAATVSTDGLSLFVANSGSHSVSLRQGDTWSTLVCQCDVVSLERIAPNAFLLNGTAANPLWVLDASGDEPHLVFVPAAFEVQP